MTLNPLSTAPSSEHRFSVSDAQEQVPFLTSEQADSKYSAPYGKSRLRTLAYGFYATAIVLLFGGLWRQPSDTQCVHKLNAWSPVLDAVKYQQELQPALSESKFIGNPTDEMEAAWDKLWKFGSMSIPESQLPRLNKSATEFDWHYLQPEVGGGIQAYIEGFHYIHCLNLVRQYIYRNERDYSYLFFFSNENISALEHTEHCIEMLRAKVLCESDTAVYHALPERNGRQIIHTPADQRCRDFDAAANWANEHITVPIDH